MINKKKTIAIVAALLLLTNTVTFVVVNNISLVMGNRVIISKDNYEDLVKFNKLFAVRDIIQEEYVDKIDENKLIEGAVQGLAAGVGDPYTAYWDPKEYEANTIQTEGEYAGVGLVVEPKEDRIVIVSPIEDTPAEKAGIKSGDIIVRVDDKEVSGKDLDGAVSMMRGKPGTSVKITIAKEGTSSLVDINIVRANIVIKSVKGEMLPSNIAYIRISAFQANTAADFSKVLKNLKGNGMKGLIIDLRNNGGGLLDQCVKISDELIGEGTIVYTIDNKGQKQVMNSDKNKVGVPLAILVNGGTASASEIVSGAVKDTNTGTLIGTRTFGKGLVQTIIPMRGDKSAVKVTTARYYTPSGVSIQGKGIDPNIVIDIPESLKNKGELTRQEDNQFNKAVEVIKQQIQ